MVKQKNVRGRGKLQLSRYFQKLGVGDSVAVVKEVSLQPRFPKRLQGKTGIVSAKRGSSYVVEINDQNQKKSYIIAPIHLKKIKATK